MSLRRGRPGRRLFGVVTILAIVSMLALTAQVGLQDSAAQNRGATRISSSSDSALSRVQPMLREMAQASPNAGIAVNAYVAAGTDLSAYMPDGIARAKTTPNGMTIVSGTIKGRNVLKAAGVHGVVMMTAMRGAFVPADYEARADGSTQFAPSAALRAQMSQVIQSTEGSTTMNLDQANGIVPNDWADVGDAVHKSAEAWAMGYTGEGVKVMVNDSGVDFANPDLYGTWATVDNPNSPYAGWPMQFDQYSMYLMARDAILGETNIADGDGYYADTSTVITTADSSYQPLDADAANSYTLTGTSMSGNYHIGTHPDNSLRSWYFVATGQEQGEDEDGQRPAVLVVDEHEAGVYDTVYVDLDFDNDFSDEAPVTKESPVSGRDWWGAYDADSESFAPEPDGYYDITGGLVYWIADGVNPVPAIDWLWGIGLAGNGVQDEGEADAGNLVAFAVNDFVTSPAGDHGTLVASGIAAQGVISSEDSIGAAMGDTPSGVVPSYAPGDSGVVVGAGQDVKIVSAGDFYSLGTLDAFWLAALGYDGVPGTADDIQIINNSWGALNVYNDGWDELSRAIDQVTRLLNPTLLVMVSAGNSGPGFGTVGPPVPPNGMIVGASTVYGSTGWDSASSADQVTSGDIATFSSRGPNATGADGVDIVASGAYAAGDIPVNLAMTGAQAWTTWGGTSRSAPVTAGNAALVYQAYRATYGSWPNYDMAKMLLKSGATDLHYNPFLQGAGMVNAAASVEMATGSGGMYVWPNEWRVGDFNGVEYPGFAHVIQAGGSDEQVFQINNPSSEVMPVTVSDQWLQKTGEWETEWTSSPISDEPITIDEDGRTSMEDWNTPHYLFNVTDKIPEGTDVVVLRMNYPSEQFNPSGSYSTSDVNFFYFLGYDWTDVDGDGQLWTDADGDGVVDQNEIDKGEYVRTGYANQRANNHQVPVQRPLGETHDGLFIGLQHGLALADVPQTSMVIGMDFYKRVDMPWLSVQAPEQLVPAQASGYVTVKADVPADAATGIYEASVMVDYGSGSALVPVTINVVGNQTNINAGATDADAAGSMSFYNNNEIAGGQNWGDADSGDWRFYFSNMPDEDGPLGHRMPDGTYFYLADVDWGGDTSDVEVYTFGPEASAYSDPEVEEAGVIAEPEYFGPYTLAVTGSGIDTLAGSGIYRVDTSSGTSREVVAAPFSAGLNGIGIHNTNFDGEQDTDPVSVRTGMLAVSQSPITTSGPVGADRSMPMTVVSSIPLSGLTVQGFGLSKPVAEAGVEIQQDDPNDPSTSSITRELTLENAGLLEVSAVGGDDDDIDLFVLRDINEDGEFDFDTEVVATSTTPTADEHVRIVFPQDGDYLIAVHGWAIPGGTSTVDLSILAVQGDDIQASDVVEGALPAFQNEDFNVNLDTEGLEPGEYTGLVTLGPPEGPSAVLVFVNYTVR